MAQHKYDLLLVPTNTNRVIRQQPWYKERLKTKYLKQKKKSDTSPSLIGRNWILVRSGLDDFRSGVPLDFGDHYIVEGAKGISPVVKQNKNAFSSRLRKDKTSKLRPELSKSQIFMDKELPQQRKRRDRVAETEYDLMQHPLALHPHYEEGMSPELFEEIVDLLDPEMNPDMGSETERTETNTEQNSSEQISGSELPFIPCDEETVEEKIRSVEAKTRNPYKWILRKDDDQKDDKKGFKKRPTSPSQDEHIKKVTKEFCDWVSNLGGDSNNVEESTIMSLFASGYETKPALSVPIHVVELSNVPAELRISAGLSPPGSARKSRLSSAVPTHHSSTDIPSGYQPSWVKIKYGAWYLDPESWKVRPENEPLEDPEEITKREKSESKKKSQEMDGQLAPLHGAKAFREFLERCGKRKPEFMDRVARIQDEEAAKNDANQQKINHLSPSRRSTSRGYPSRGSPSRGSPSYGSPPYGSPSHVRSSLGFNSFSPP